MPPVSMPEESIVRQPKKVIIDTDPGIDDAMAILLAFESPELDIIGMTTTYGNVRTKMATKNALHLCDLGGRDDIPVSQGLETSLRGEIKDRIADFVHGQDGLGNTNPKPPKRSAIAQSAPEFFIQKCKEYPGEVTIVALGPLTNLAKAVEDDPTFAKNVGQIIVLGGAFSVNGNVNPAAEANIYGDPEAADIVFTCGANTVIIGINITHQVFFTDKEMEEVRDSQGKYAKYLYDVSRFYFDYHHGAYDIDETSAVSSSSSITTTSTSTVSAIMKGTVESPSQSSSPKLQYVMGPRLSSLPSEEQVDDSLDIHLVDGKVSSLDTAIYLHDPTTMVAAINPSLFTYAEGVVRVQRDGICKGLTVFNNTQKKWAEPTDWCNLPQVKVAMTVDAPAVSKLMKDRLMGVIQIS